jgi:hypothetical protein
MFCHGNSTSLNCDPPRKDGEDSQKISSNVVGSDSSLKKPKES